MLFYFTLNYKTSITIKALIIYLQELKLDIIYFKNGKKMFSIYRGYAV